MASTQELQPESIPSRIAETVWNADETDRLPEFVTPGYVRHDPTYPAPVRGREGYADLLREMRTGVPDLRVTIDAAMADGDVILYEFTFEGTHEGPFQGVPPTGRHVRLSGAGKIHVEDGLVTEEWLYYDPGEFRRQIGLTFPAVLGHAPRFARYYYDRLNERRSRGSRAS